MKKKLIILVLSIILISSFFILKNLNDAKNNKLKNEDCKKITKNINKILSLENEIMKTHEFKSSKGLIENPKLLKFIEKRNQFKVKWYKRVNLKCTDYKTSTVINKIKKISSNKYILKVTFTEEFQLIDLKEKSLGQETYFIQVQSINKNWYITKILSQEDLKDNSKEIHLSKGLFKDYDKLLDRNLKSIDEISKNIEKYAKKVSIK